MITILEKEYLSGDCVVKSGRQKIAIDPINHRINIISTGVIGIDEATEFAKALELANMIASGKISLKERQEIDWANLACSVGGMPNNSKGYIDFSSLYVSIDDLSLRVNNCHYPMYKIPLSGDDYLILIRNSEGEYQINRKDINSRTCAVKKHNKFDPIVSLI